MKRSDSTLPVCKIGLASLLVCTIVASCAREERPTRVVLVTLDTLRADRFTAQHMPLTFARAARGAVFTEFYSATSTTQPTHATLLTGLEPWRHEVRRNGSLLGAAHETLAERLGRAGFASRAVVASFPLERRFGFDQGYQAYDDDFELRPKTAKGEMQVWSGAQLEQEDEFYSLADAVTRKALEALDAAEGPRQHFWFHYYDPHAPYGDDGDDPLDLHVLTQAAKDRSPGLSALLERAREGYDRDCAYLDRELDRLLARLEADSGRYETHVLVTSDHGESLGDEGSIGHGRRLIRSQVHVPTFLLSPRVAPAVRADPAGSVDVLPTLLALAGLPPDAELAGRDLAAPPPREPPPPTGMRRTYVKPYPDVRTDGSVVPIQGPHFYLVHRGRLWMGDSERLELESPSDDAALDEKVRALFAAFERQLARGGEGEEDVSEETQRRLEALGYTR